MTTKTELTTLIGDGFQAITGLARAFNRAAALLAIVVVLLLGAIVVFVVA